MYCSKLSNHSVFAIFCLLFTHQQIVESKPLLSELFHQFFGAGGSRSTRADSSLSANDFEQVNYTLPQIWLTVSPVVEIDSKSAAGHPQNTSVVRAVELHWNAGPDGPKQGDYLELYDLNSAVPRPIMRYLLRDDHNRTKPKYIKTNIEFPYMNQSHLDSLIQTTNFSPYQTPHGLISGQCLHFYLAYIGANNRVAALNCIQMNARWMQREFEVIKGKTLEELMLPGTHDATSFERYKLSDYETNVITRFQYTQDENLYAQLAYGIRYLDMRVGAYNLTDYYPLESSGGNQSTNTSAFYLEELWMVHDIQRNHINLRDALRQVKRFLERTTHEVIIVDFHRFVNGFLEVDDLAALQNRLRNFYKIVIEQLGPFLIRYSSYRQANIGELVRDGKRVILGYAYKYDPRGLFDTDMFWPAVEHLWANTDQLNSLETYMKERICNRNSARTAHNSDIHLQSTMAELTPTIEGIIFQRYHGLRELAAIANSHFDHWFRKLWWKCANIVAADFFLGSDLVQIAIDVNRKRFSNQTAYGTSILVNN